MIEAIAHLIALPFTLLAVLLRLRQRWRGVPLQQKNLTRATAGAFVLVGCAVLAVHGFPIAGPLATGGLALGALLYLIVGIHGARSPGAFDPMSAFWWAVLVMIAGALLAFRFLGFPL
jgi:hypothetical protein